MKFILSENQLNKLYEIGGGAYSDGQLDLFLEPNEMESFKENGNQKFLEILKDVERKCGWTHDPKRDSSNGEWFVHQCYPMRHFYYNEPCPRSEFVEMLSSRISNKYLKTSYARTAIRPEDWYVTVMIRKI